MQASAINRARSHRSGPGTSCAVICTLPFHTTRERIKIQHYDGKSIPRVNPKFNRVSGSQTLKELLPYQRGFFKKVVARQAWSVDFYVNEAKRWSGWQSGCGKRPPTLYFEAIAPSSGRSGSRIQSRTDRRQHIGARTVIHVRRKYADIFQDRIFVTPDLLEIVGAPLPGDEPASGKELEDRVAEMFGGWLPRIHARYPHAFRGDSGSASSGARVSSATQVPGVRRASLRTRRVGAAQNLNLLQELRRKWD